MMVAMSAWSDATDERMEASAAVIGDLTVEGSVFLVAAGAANRTRCTPRWFMFVALSMVVL
jgi:hypothetical protein